MQYTLEERLAYLNRERKHLREVVSIAKEELNAGNERMRQYLEGYTNRLDSIVLEIQEVENQL